MVIPEKRTLGSWGRWLGVNVRRRLTNAIRLIMVIPEKRTLGSWGRWLGVHVIPNLGLVVVPRDKILRASAASADVLERGVHFHAYRSLLCGRLEHLRAVNLQARNFMVGLYRHHGPTGASKFGLTDWVTCDPLMRQQLLRGQALLFEPCGVSVKRALLRVELEDPPKVPFDVTSDTCLADVDHAGIGGFCHGLFWFYTRYPKMSDLTRPSSNTSVGPAEPGSTGPTCASLYARTPSLQRLPFQRAPLMPRSCRMSTITFSPPPNGDAVLLAGGSAPVPRLQSGSRPYLASAVAGVSGALRAPGHSPTPGRGPPRRRFRRRRRADLTVSAMRVGGNSLAAQRRHRAQLSLHRTSGPPPPSAQPPPLLSPVRSPPATIARRAQAESVLRTVGLPARRRLESSRPR